MIASLWMKLKKVHFVKMSNCSKCTSSLLARAVIALLQLMPLFISPIDVVRHMRLLQSFISTCEIIALMQLLDSLISTSAVIVLMQLLHSLISTHRKRLDFTRTETMNSDKASSRNQRFSKQNEINYWFSSRVRHCAHT